MAEAFLSTIPPLSQIETKNFIQVSIRYYLPHPLQSIQLEVWQPIELFQSLCVIFFYHPQFDLKYFLSLNFTR